MTADDVLALQHEAGNRGMVAIWTIYDRPHGFIARLHTVPGGPTDKTIVDGLDKIRRILSEAGLVKLQRQEDDDPPIVES